MTDLVQLYNTLCTVQTSGSSTITMANCLLFLQKMINAETLGGDNDVQ